MKELFSGVALGKNFNAKNRLVRSSTWEGLCDCDGYVTPALCKMYEELAQGGVGTIVTGITYVERGDQPSRNMMGLDDDCFIPNCKKLCDVVHKHDCRLVVQLGAGGSMSHYKTDLRRVYAPSSHPDSTMYEGAEEITRAEIEALIQNYAAACVRAKKSGFDAIQIHAAHGFLISQFFEPRFNWRNDEYGGSLENRARFLFEIYDAARAAVGEEYPIWIKINCEDFMGSEGLLFEEARWICTQLATRGIDLIEISGGNCNSTKLELGPMRSNIKTVDDEGYFLSQAEIIAEDVDVPVMSVGGYRSVQKMQETLAKTKIEMIAMCRPLICEPDLPNRMREGTQDRASCFSCLDLRCKKIYGGECLYRRVQRLKRGKA